MKYLSSVSKAFVKPLLFIPFIVVFIRLSELDNSFSSIFITISTVLLDYLSFIFLIFISISLSNSKGKDLFVIPISSVLGFLIIKSILYYNNIN